MTDRIRLPTPPEAPEQPGVPWITSLAPVIGAVAVWAFTRTPYALLFALLGPLVALGGLLDARRRHRKSTGAARVRYERELGEVRERIDEAHDAERRDITRHASSGLDILARGRPTHERWRSVPGEPLTITLGVGTVRSAIAADGAEPRELVTRASTLSDAPVACDARHGIGVIGAGAGANALVRALTMQLAHAVSPQHARLELDAGSDALATAEFEWLRLLPHAAAGAETPEPSREHPMPKHVAVNLTERHPDPSRTPLATIALAADEHALPPSCRTAVRINGTSLDIVRWPAPDSAPTNVRPHLLTRASTERLAAQLRRTAIADGLLSDDSVPARVTASALDAQPPADRSSLACAFALGARSSPITVDLVGEGPHALVGGTTGSGKSELLCAWVYALARTRSPSELTVLLVDFKGGASFRTVDSLPHIVGTITDLDHVQARRALESLTAELTFRERELARSGVRDISELPNGILPRLVVVVDEYAALVSEHPSLHTVFADIAARGRSLGMHLILATQRPAGIVRDSILANIPLRVSLRVLDVADSSATIGAPDAARIPGNHPGRALLVTPLRPMTALQPALVTAHDAEAVRQSGRHRETPTPRRPWQPPLPAIVTHRDLEAADRASPRAPGPALRFALADLPREQRRGVAEIDLDRVSNLLIVGARGSGRTTSLAALADAARDSGLNVTRMPADVEGAWDGVHEALSSVRTHGKQPRLLLVDDVDIVLSRMPDDHRDALHRALASLLAEGPARGTTCALSVGRVGAISSSLANMCDARLILRTADRGEHHAAGGDPQVYSADLPPGRGWYRGDVVHVVTPTTASRDDNRGDVEARAPLPRDVRAIVSARPAELVERLAAVWGSNAAVHLTGVATRTLEHASTDVSTEASIAASIDMGTQEAPSVLVADPDTWQSRYGMFTQLRRAERIAFHDCTLSQFRQLSGSRDLPPPLARPADTVWLTHPGGQITRAGLPEAVDSA